MRASRIIRIILNKVKLLASDCQIVWEFNATCDIHAYALFSCATIAFLNENCPMCVRDCCALSILIFVVVNGNIFIVIDVVDVAFLLLNRLLATIFFFLTN